MYSNDPAQIRSGLMNYLGTYMSAIKAGSIKDAKQQTIAMLIESAIKIATDEDTGLIDLYAIKPLLRANKILYQQRAAELEKVKSVVPAAQSSIKMYQDNIKFIDDMLSSIS
jgi:hypothetical protein